MRTQYNQKRQRAEQLLEQHTFPQVKELEVFCERLCAAPFIRKEDTISLWLELWPLLDSSGRGYLAELPDPCLKHVESRMNKPNRREHLEIGVKRLIEQDQHLLLEGLRLFPHAVCRTAEAVGPLADENWREVLDGLRNDRLWQLQLEGTDTEFWNSVDALSIHRDLPQAILDFVDDDRPRENAPLSSFRASLETHVLRKRIEKIRSATYAHLRCHQDEPTIRSGSSR